MSDLVDALPIVMTLLVTVLTNNLINSMALGTIGFIALQCALGHSRQVTGIVWSLRVVFLAYFFVTARLM